jgi:hypothetical protein
MFGPVGLPTQRPEPLLTGHGEEDPAGALQRHPCDEARRDPATKAAALWVATSPSSPRSREEPALGLDPTAFTHLSGLAAACSKFKGLSSGMMGDTLDRDDG